MGFKTLFKKWNEVIVFVFNDIRTLVTQFIRLGKFTYDKNIIIDPLG